MSMSRVKNISGGPRDLVVPGFEAHVEDGETLEVPDFQPGHNPASKEGDPDYLPIVYPEATWEPVAEPKVKPEKAAKAADGTGV